ncbi:MAG: Gfo/Idh/MocA family oxidoreductase [Candidatus Bathyarchaeia archaeon]
MDEGLKVALIGCGWAGEQHARAYSSIPEVKLLATVDSDGGKARELARRWGAEAWYDDYRAVLRDPRIDAVSICLPHYLHSKVSVESAEAGKHILCEKPMANSLAEADEMIKAARKASVILMIAENVRFHPINLKIKELTDLGFIGEVFLARIFRDHEMHDYLRRRPWFLNREKAGGGIWMSGGIHDVDALRMILGDVETVTLFQAKKILAEMEGDDTSVAVLRFKSGALGIVTESFSTKTFKPLSPNGCPFLINGSIGTIKAFMDGIEVYGEKVGSPDRSIHIRVEGRDTFIEEVKHFVECVRRHEIPITSGEEERKTLAVVCAGYESLEKGSIPIRVRY